MSLTQLVLPMLLLGQAADSDASLEAMQKRVEPTRISLLSNAGTNDGATNARLVERPVLRYSDELRQIEDAGIWLWTDRSRPVAAMKVERYKPGRLQTQWLYCFTSLSSQLVRAEWIDAMPFQTRQPGVKWQALDDEPANTRPARLLQLRELSRRFSAELLADPDGTNRLQMRLLTRPLYRCDESTEVLDGAVFGFAGTGTNPDFLLLFDLARDGGWRFGAAGMTTEGVKVKLNDRVVYENPHTAGKGKTFDTWCYFRPTK
jgi:hypothetical protein